MTCPPCDVELTPRLRAGGARAPDSGRGCPLRSIRSRRRSVAEHARLSAKAEGAVDELLDEHDGHAALAGGFEALEDEVDDSGASPSDISSAMISRGGAANARASASICCSPPDSVPARLAASTGEHGEHLVGVRHRGLRWSRCRPGERPSAVLLTDRPGKIPGPRGCGRGPRGGSAGPPLGDVLPPEGDLRPGRAGPALTRRVPACSCPRRSSRAPPRPTPRARRSNVEESLHRRVTDAQVRDRQERSTHVGASSRVVPAGTLDGLVVAQIRGCGPPGRCGSRPACPVAMQMPKSSTDTKLDKPEHHGDVVLDEEHRHLLFLDDAAQRRAELRGLARVQTRRRLVEQHDQWPGCAAPAQPRPGARFRVGAGGRCLATRESPSRSNRRLDSVCCSSESAGADARRSTRSLQSRRSA